MTESHQLLAEYVECGSEAAFRELVTRHLGLVYSAAIRLVGGDAQLAEDVSQTVFVDLARQARTFSGEVMLGGWLHQHTCFVAANTLRGERRRQSRERQAMEMTALQDHSEADFSRVAPILDAAITELGEPDRTAILLRFFEQHDFRQIGEMIGSSEDAARMRVSRAREKLELLLKRRGITSTVAALSVVLSAHAVQAVPAGLAASISTAALAGTALSTSTAVAVAKTVAMTTMQKALVAATVVVAAGTGIYEARQATRLRADVETLQQRQAPLAEEIQRLTQALGDATNQVAVLRAENERLGRDAAEILKLRGERAQLRADSQELARLKASEQQQENDPNGLTPRLWLSRADTLKKWMESHPDQQIPEFQYLRQDNWLDVVKNNNLAGDYAPLHAASQLREVAKHEFANEMVAALRRFIAEHGGELPTDLSQLNPYFSKPMTGELMSAYKLLHSGNIAQVTKGEWLVAETRPQEDPGHTHFVIGTNMWNTIR